MIENTPTPSKRGSDRGGKGDHLERRSYTNANYSVPYMQQQPQQYYVAPTNDAYTAAATAQQATGINTAYYYTAQPATALQVQQTY
ncbi:unnamed protein product [Toxocara canis]|uniref:Uncharacterized protein n=1 Tax=Toxocara canis TaxID=6265 RepID=A0A3P7GME4_TOXCA|nr:unnamed protein product [Toxocara canis]